VQSAHLLLGLLHVTEEPQFAQANTATANECVVSFSPNTSVVKSTRIRRSFTDLLFHTSRHHSISYKAALSAILPDSLYNGCSTSCYLTLPSAW
jgi:hypothetical protein